MRSLRIDAAGLLAAMVAVAGCTLEDRRISAPDASWTPAHLAAQAGDLAALRSALRAGTPVDVHTRQGETPLLLACWKGRLAAIDLLVEAGADVAVPSRTGVTPLLAAVCADRPEAISRLATRAERLLRDPKPAQEAAFFARVLGRDTCVQRLDELGVKLEPKMRSVVATYLAVAGAGSLLARELAHPPPPPPGGGDSLYDMLCMAARWANPGTVRVLLAAGAVPDRVPPGIDGGALHSALVFSTEGAEAEFRVKIRRLVEAWRKDPDQRERVLMAPLIRRIATHDTPENRAKVVELLLAAGADPRAKDAAGRTPLEAAGDLANSPAGRLVAKALAGPAGKGP